ncbi:DUF3943 domain-containing protein [Rhizobacter sp. Root404]|uniref:DUF3943 domain-containing protein n=1 Tax=Rhizobacter sp. Root404 TaxID=1736528 RepID=UPI0006F7A14A|nr:DUF3943 domain-containing protein [Rhizobacter sp. Root404]KQW36505.1 hypothetical protein ASC76_17720 [Rhizobacter sp. Root404]
MNSVILFVGGVLWSSGSAFAQVAPTLGDPVPPAGAASTAAAAEGATPAAAKSYAIPAAEIIGFDFLLNRYNRRFSGSTDYDVSGASIRRNLRGPWVVDNDPFSINQFAHPYQGSIYHTAARSAGLGYWESSGYAFLGSVWWEITGEQTPPSRNDQIASGIAGSFLGEPLYRMARLMLNRRSEVPYAWRAWGAAAVSPSYGFNRLVFGDRFESSFDDHDPIYYARLRIGANRGVRGTEAADNVERNTGEIDFAMDYGLPGSPGYTYTRPFDYFNFRAAATSANGIEIVSSRGLLVGTDYAVGANYRGVWGLYANYDYLAPQLFHLSTTAVSIGTTGQWWARESLALQGTLMAGLGYSAASAWRPTADDRDYHYGVAPRIGVSMRAIAGSTVSFDLDAQKYFMGRIANRGAGADDVSRVDAALTWRVHGRHAIGVKYAWSHRHANFPVAPDRVQTVAAVGVYYTLLGLDTFGTVDWRVPK